MNRGYYIENNKIIDSNKLFNTHYEFQIVEHIPYGCYLIWNIHFVEGYLPLAELLPNNYGFSPEKEHIDAANNVINQWKKECPEACIESCAEHDLISTERIGCLSKKDLNLLGLKMENTDDAGYQRHGCLCCSAKTELLSKKERCPYQCMYCYWKD